MAARDTGAADQRRVQRLPSTARQLPHLITPTSDHPCLSTAAPQFSRIRLPRERERTGSGDRAGNREHGAHHQKLYVGSCEHRERSGEQGTAERSPSGKPRKRHLIEPSFASEHAEHAREHGTREKAEQAKEERKRDVGGVEAHDSQENQPRPEPRRCPDQPHSDCGANAPQPLLHCTLQGACPLDRRPWFRSGSVTLYYKVHCQCEPVQEDGRIMHRAIVMTLDE